MASVVILVVEDNLKLNQNIVDILSFEGYDVLSAMSIEEAKQLYLDVSPSIVLLDIMLPDGNSYQELSAFRRDKETYIIMLTALDVRETKRICYENGADDYITKPFALDELVMKIKAVSRRMSFNNPVLCIGDIKVDKKNQTIESKRVETLSPALFQVLKSYVITISRHQKPLSVMRLKTLISLGYKQPLIDLETTYMTLGLCRYPFEISIKRAMY